MAVEEKTEQMVERVHSDANIQNRATMQPETKQKISILVDKMNELAKSFINGKNHRDLSNEQKEIFSVLVSDFTYKLDSIKNNQHQAKKHLVEAVYLYKKLNQYIPKNNIEGNEFKKNWGAVKNQIIQDCHIKISPFKAVAAQLTSAKIPNFFFIKTRPEKTSNTYFAHMDNPRFGS